VRLLSWAATIAAAMNVSEVLTRPKAEG